MGEIAHLASTSERGTGFQPVICDTHSQDGCAPLVSTGGAPLYQASLLGDFQRRASSQMILKLAPYGTARARGEYPRHPGELALRVAGHVSPFSFARGSLPQRREASQGGVFVFTENRSPTAG